MSVTLICPCHFGLESVLAGEVRRMGGENVAVSDGRVSFTGEEELIARANLWLRTAERVLIKLGEFPARTFDELFEGTKKLRLETYIGEKDAFPVTGYSLNSALHSVPDCQRIIKKAAVESMRRAYGISWFEESGSVHQIRFSLFKDTATIMLDTSGAGLHKRGYRQNANEAPIRETLAAGMLDIVRIYPDSCFSDPFCGSGTFLIEAASKAMNLAPGLRRSFAVEKWGFLSPSVFESERARALEMVRKDISFEAYGSDLDPDAVALARDNAQKAGVSGVIRFKTADIRSYQIPGERTTLVTNPPYGERMLELREARELYRIMGEKFPPGHRYGIISPDEEFESFFGRKAGKRRKLYNGMLRCQFYLYL